MLKFFVEPKESGGPAYVGLGLSHENLRLLRRTAIQFHGADLGLGPGVFVVAHANDPLRPTYETRVGADVCDLVTLAEETCVALQFAGEVVNVPLRSTRAGQLVRALVFAGPTEKSLVDAMRARGMVNSTTQVTGDW